MEIVDQLKAMTEYLDTIQSTLKTWRENMHTCVEKMDVIERMTLKEELKQILEDAEKIDNSLNSMRDIVHNRVVEIEGEQRCTGCYTVTLNGVDFCHHCGKQRKVQ